MTKKPFSKSRLERLKKDTQDFRTSMEDKLVEYFKDRPTEEVIRIMADWLSLDELLELTGRVSEAQIVEQENSNVN
jgi:hypothetical protein